MEPKQHEALKLPLPERVAYLTVVASMAAADVVLEPEETAKLRALCAELGLPEKETKEVLDASQSAKDAVKRHLEYLSTSDLRFALLSDCVSLAYADGEYGKAEREEVRALARSLSVEETQLVAIEEYVRAVRAATADPEKDHRSTGAEIASRLASVGVPVGVIAGVSAVGLEVVGASTGLAALGLGLGIASGFGAAVGLGVGTYMGVRWLKNKLTGQGG